VTEEFEFWHVLLLFAGLVYVTYSVRDKLPFWQDKDPRSPYNRRRRTKEARQVVKQVRGILSSKKGIKVPSKGRKSIETCLESVENALKEDDSEGLEDHLKHLDKLYGCYLEFARKSSFREFSESIGVAILIAVILRLFVFEAFKIPSESMVPTLMVGDHIFVNKYRYGLTLPFTNKRMVQFLSPRRGDVVVFVKPKSSLAFEESFFEQPKQLFSTDFIKRIVALQGDTVAVKDDQIIVNAKPIPRCRIGTQRYRGKNDFTGRWEDDEADLWLERFSDDVTYTVIEVPGRLQNFGPQTVPAGHVFVMGDNRDNSSDSRMWGTVPIENIKGRAMFIWWSNLRPHGFAWHRVGNSIMSEPKLDEDSRSALEQCANML